MKVEYPYKGVIPSSVVRGKSSLRSWMLDFKLDVMGIAAYSRAKARGEEAHGGAFVYIDSFASMSLSLFEHYVMLPDVYFTLLMKARETVFNTPPELEADLKDRVPCLNKMLLILHLAVENDQPNRVVYEREILKIRKQINLNVLNAVNMHDEAYLSKICREFAATTNNKSAKRDFLKLAEKYGKGNLLESVSAIPENKKASRSEMRHRRKYGADSPLHFKSEPQSSLSSSSQTPSSWVTFESTRS